MQLNTGNCPHIAPHTRGTSHSLAHPVQTAPLAAASSRSPCSLRSKTLPSRRREEGFRPQAGLSEASALLSTGLCLAIGWQLLQQEGASDNDQMEGRQSCMRCNGAGYEPCFCQKWSDGDVGCSACAKSGYMRCRNCGGGGTLMPAFQPLKIEAQKQDR